MLATILAEAIRVVQADRAAVLWVDEYGAGLAHVHAVVDVASDTPRRGIAWDVLDTARQLRIPGVVDVPERRRALRKEVPECASAGAAAPLGSDGAKTWFLVVDQLAPREPLDAKARQALYFLAGRCTSLLLHRDLSARQFDGAATSEFERRRARAFAGWGPLGDLQGRQDDPFLANGRIQCRFLLARTFRTLVEEAFSVDRASLTSQVAATRSEIASAGVEGDEPAHWEGMLGCIERGDLAGLSARAADLGDLLESQGHYDGAREFYLSGFETGEAVHSLPSAYRNAILMGRSQRRLAEWAAAERWLSIAAGLARALEDPVRAAEVAVERAGALRDRGRLEDARGVLLQALSTDVTDATAKGRVNHDLMTVYKQEGDMIRAARHGWRAVREHSDEQRRLQALFDLGGVFTESGQLEAAEDAYRIVAEGIDREEYRVITLDALAFLAARRGDRAEYEIRSAAVDGANWENCGPIVAGQILLYRGLAWQELGELSQARHWLERAVEFGTQHGLGKIRLDAEAALGQVESKAAAADLVIEATVVVDDEVCGICEELSQMRRRIVGA